MSDTESTSPQNVSVEDMMKGVKIWDKDGNPKWVGSEIPDEEPADDEYPEMDESTEDFEAFRKAFANPENIQIIPVGKANGRLYDKGS